jgi:hypothetical protein
MDQREIDRRFTYYPPKPGQPERYKAIRDWARDFATAFEDHSVPDSREKSLALTALEECVMWANAAIARNE